MSKRDYYEVLGVDRNATTQQLKSAYRKLAIKYHPDRNPGNKRAEENFKEAAEAYSVLSDPNRRVQYDRFGHAGLGGGAGGGFDPDIFSDFSDILGDFFGFGDIFGGRRGERTRARRGADLRYNLQISFKDAAFGVKTTIQIPRREMCETCNGSGANPATGPVTCPACGGRGQTRYQQGFFTISRTCSQCHGSGHFIKDLCKQCHGQGSLQKKKTLEIRIPAGVDEGSRLRIAGEGEAGEKGGPPGDLYIVVSVAEHPFFKRQNHDIYCEVPLTFSQAALGTEINVRTLTGKESLKIPQGTQTGTVFRLKNRGMVSLNGHGQGDQFVKVKVVTPTRLSDEQKELLHQLSALGQDEIHEDSSFFDKVKEIFG
ncbi:MAG: molecular chaperone DnaJ [Acidobacteriota bacterium]